MTADFGATSPQAADRPNGRPLVVTMGDPAGIGAEITIKAWHRRRELGLPPFFTIANLAQLRHTATSLKVAAECRPIADPGEAGKLFDAALPVIDLELPATPEPGTPTVANADAVTQSIEQAVRFCLRGATGGMVTNPINKKILYRGGFNYSGHTDYLGALCGGDNSADEPARPVMMLACAELRTALVTVHVPLSGVADELSRAEVEHAGRVLARALDADFGCTEARVVVAALNPHGGEDGALGREEIDIIEPAVQALREEGLRISGPFAADSLFRAERRKQFDAVLCMYHDQALIALKAIDAANIVNITVGLAIVRTSPGHGTAFDIAGKGVADERSLAAAIRAAGDIARRRAALGAAN